MQAGIGCIRGMASRYAGAACYEESVAFRRRMLSS